VQLIYPLFDDKPAGPRKIVVPSREEMLGAVADFDSPEGRRRRRAIKQPTKPPKPRTEKRQTVSLGKITQEYERRAEGLTIFPNAYQLGLDAERAVYATILAYFWQKEGKLTAQLTQSEAREQTLEHFMGNHRKKAFGVADTIFRLRKATLAQSSDPAKVVELFFNYAHQDHRAVQLGLRDFETVIFNPGNTLHDLKNWAELMAKTGESAQMPYFEMLVESRLGSRVIKHPFDIVFADFTGDLHIIELTNRHRESYVNKARLVEDALLELAADRITVGEVNQQIYLLKPQRHIGAGEVWAIKDRPEADKILRGVRLSNEEMNEALSLLKGAKLAVG